MFHSSVDERPNYSYTDKWPNKLVAQVVFLTAKGYSAPQIHELFPATGSPGAITKMIQHWGVEGVRPSDGVAIMVPLTPMQRSHIHSRASQHQLRMEEYARRLLVCCAMPRDRYGEIVPPDQFEDIKS